MTKVAAILIHKELEKIVACYGGEASIVNLVHDEIVTEESEGLQKHVEYAVKKCMEDAGKLFCKTVPMVVEPHSSLAWKK